MRLRAALLAMALGAQGASGQLAAPAATELPSGVVARLAREALAAPGESASWRALAGALPDLALLGGADLEGTLEAARLADSLAATPPPLAPAPLDTTRAEVPALAGSPGRVDAVVVWLQSAGGTLALILAGVLGWFGIVSWRSARNRKAGGGAAKAPPRPTGPGRAWSVRTLATGGLPVGEIARRTGLAREAVDLALALAGSAPPRPPRGSAAPTPPPADAALRASLDRGVRGLRDRRLTYGGGLS